MTRVKGISIFTETGQLRWRVTQSSCKLSDRRSWQQIAKLNALNASDGRLFFGGRFQLDPSGDFWGRWRNFLALKAGKGAPRARLKPLPQLGLVTS